MLVEGEYIITATLNISLTRLDCIWLAGVNTIQNSLHFIDLFTIKKWKKKALENLKFLIKAYKILFKVKLSGDHVI